MENIEEILDIKTAKYNNRIYFNMKDIRSKLIDDLEIIIVKLEYFNINIKVYDKEYIDMYSLVLLITFSNDFRTYKYKFFLCSSTIEIISQIKNPDLCIDKAKSLRYKRNINECFNFKQKDKHIDTEKTFKDIIIEQINYSLNTDAFRQII